MVLGETTNAGLGSIISNIFSGTNKPDNNFWNNYYENGIISNLWKGFTGQKSADRNTDITNATNKEIADENLGYQKELFEYNKALQQSQWEREDTAYQRTAHDMLAAGLNPLTMQGTDGAGEVVAQSALHNDYQHQSRQVVSSPMAAMSALSSAASEADSIKTGQLTRDSLQLENDKKRLENLLEMKRLGVSISSDQYSGLKEMNDRSDMLGTYAFENEKWNHGTNFYNEQNAEREYNHMVSAGKYQSDTQMSNMLTDLEDWALNGRAENMFNKIPVNSFCFSIGL